MLRDNYYTYNDEYLYFTFNGIHSSEYNLFITNKNDLKIENGVSESSEYTSAMFQEGAYYMGTKRTQKTFKRKCAAGGITLSQYKEMMVWLTQGSRGFLVFDNNPWWGWTVVLDSVGDATIMDRNGKLVVEFDITWKTIGTFLARNRYLAYSHLSDAVKPVVDNNGDILSTCNGTYNESMQGNEWGIPTIYYEYQFDDSGNVTGIKNNSMFILGISNVHQHLNYTYKTDSVGSVQQSSALKILYENIPYVDLATGITDYDNINSVLPVVIEYNGESNLILANDELVETKNYFKYNYQSYGLMQLPSITPKEIHPDAYSENSIVLNEEDFNEYINGEYNAICIVKKLNCAKEYNKDYPDNEYPQRYETYILLDNSGFKASTTYDLDALMLNSYIENIRTLSNTEILIEDGYSRVSDIDEDMSLYEFLFNINANSTFSIDNSFIDKTEQNGYKYYLVKANEIKIYNTGALKYENSNINDAYITVVSCNNL